MKKEAAEAAAKAAKEKEATEKAAAEAQVCLFARLQLL